MEHNPQPYDTTLKSLFEGHASEIISHLVPEARFVEELNDEVLKPPLRADRVYLVEVDTIYNVLQIEMETKGDPDIAYRLLEYYGILLKKHRKSLISVVLYPFRTTLPEPMLKVVVSEEEVLTFRFRVIALWKLQAQHYLDKHVIGLYPLLPTMQGATYDLLLQALDEMRVHYAENSRLLTERLLWFGIFLKRTDMLTEKDKRKMEETIDQFDSLLAESSFVQKKMAEARAIAEARAAEAEAQARAAEAEAQARAAEAEAKIKIAEAEVKATKEAEAKLTEREVRGLREILVDVVEGRFPPLMELAQQKVTEVKEPAVLRMLVKGMATAPDEATARWVLTKLAA